MRKKLLSLTIVVLIVLSLPATAYADDTAAKVQNSVAVIATIVQIDGVEQLASWGTCFFVGKSGENPEYLFTAAHVVAEYMEYGQGQLVTGTIEDGTQHSIKIILKVFFGTNDYTEAYVVAYNDEQDIALLRLNGTTNKRTPVKLEIPTDSMAGDKIYCVGFPGLADSVLMSPTSMWGISDSVVSSGTLGRLVTTSGTGTKWLQIPDANWLSGNSGGPVCVDGAVVGLVSRGYGEQSNTEMYSAANIEAGITMLRNNNIEFAEAGSGTDMLLIYIVGGVILAALTALAIILIVKSVKKKKEPKEPTDSLHVVQVKKTPTIQSFAAQHRGARMTIPTVPVIIGRAQACCLRYEDSTPGVSREHCTLFYEESSESFVLRDLKSTYGTYLSNGQKLAPLADYRLKSGDSFYLGDSNNMLRVDLT